MSPTTSTTPTTIWPPQGWHTKNQAALDLGLSEERIAGLVREHALKARKERNPVTRQTVTLVHSGDVARYAWNKAHPEEAVRLVNKPNNQLAVEPVDKPNLLGESMPALRPANWNPHCWPLWLTMAEACQFSGLTRTAILDRIKSGALLAERNGDFGPWRISRDSLIANAGLRG